MTNLAQSQSARKPDAYLTHAALDQAMFDAAQLAEHADAAAAQLSRAGRNMDRATVDRMWVRLTHIAQQAREDKAFLKRLTAQWAAILDAEAAARRGAK